MTTYEYSWSTEDPRFTIYKYTHIIILRPRTIGYERPLICLGEAETKHSYYVSTGFEKPYNHFGADDNWPDGWVWCCAPPGIF